MLGSTKSLKIFKDESSRIILEEKNQETWRHIPTYKIYECPKDTLDTLENFFNENKITKTIKSPLDIFVANAGSGNYYIETENEYFNLLSGNSVPKKYSEAFDDLFMLIDDIRDNSKSLIEEIEEIDTNLIIGFDFFFDDKRISLLKESDENEGRLDEKDFVPTDELIDKSLAILMTYPKIAKQLSYEGSGEEEKYMNLELSLENDGEYMLLQKYNGDKADKSLISIFEEIYKLVSLEN